MKNIVTVVLMGIVMASCSKKADKTEESSKQLEIAQIVGHYPGQTLTWEKTNNGEKIGGTDDNASIDISSISDNKVNVKINTSASITNKVYEMDLKGKSGNAGAGGFVFQLVDVSGDIKINTSLKVTITTATTASIEYTQYAGASSEVYKLTGRLAAK